MRVALLRDTRIGKGFRKKFKLKHDRRKREVARAMAVGYISGLR
jgi:hypothetical protein